MDAGSDAKRAGLEDEMHDHAGEDGFPGAHPGPAVGHLPVDVVPASQAELQQQLDSAAAALQAQSLGQDGITDAQAAAVAAAAQAAAESQAAQAHDAAGADVAAAAAAAAQLAQMNAEAAQTNAVQAQLTAEQAQQQVDAMQAQQHVDAMHLAAQQFNLDPAQAAALAAAGIPVSGGLALDPAQAAALQGLNIAQLAMPGLTMDGQQLMLPDGLQLQAHELYAQHHAPEEFADMQRQQIESIRKADYQALAAAKRSGHLATIQFTLDLPHELADIELTERTGIIEVPVNGDVAMLKRLFQYQAHNKLLPALQTLITEAGEEMMDAKDDGSPIPLAQYGVGNNSTIILRIHVPEELDNVPMVDEALASAAYTTASGAARTPSRKTRWTTEQIEALIEGVEKYGLSAWRTIVMDPRLASKNNMQCKDKFRNLCLTIIQGRPERGLTLPWQLKDRVRALIEQENIKERSWLSTGA